MTTDLHLSTIRDGLRTTKVGAAAPGELPGELCHPGYYGHTAGRLRSSIIGRIRAPILGAPIHTVMVTERALNH